MTQASGAQPTGNELAWKAARKGTTLAQRRATFEAQMRDMALTELKQVSERLKGLHRELEKQQGHRITHYKLAGDMKIAPRTFQSWENGEVENSDGKGYDKIARYYSRKLGRKITRNWILFGCDKAPPVASIGMEQRNGDTAKEPTLSDVLERLEAVEALLKSERAANAEMRTQIAALANPSKRRASGEK